MKIRIDHLTYLPPIEIEQHEWVDVLLPNGMTVTVYDDMVRVATPEQVRKHQDGKRVWEAKK